MTKYKVSAVSYLNTLPFIYGINNSDIFNDINVSLDYPSECARKLLNNEVDIALVPVVVLKQNPQFKIISDYCIGADGKVDTVCLYSEVPIDKIENIYLDYQSRTSVELIKILCREYWSITPNFIKSVYGFESEIKGETAALIIGDRAFSSFLKYKYVYDLSETWKDMTGFPFVFACWVANKVIDYKFVIQLNKSFDFGLKNLKQAISTESKNYSHHENALDYLNYKISYKLDHQKRKGMDFFLNKII